MSLATMALIDDFESTNNDPKVCSISLVPIVTLMLTEEALPQGPPEAHESEAISFVQVESTFKHEGPSQQAATKKVPSVK